MGFEIPKLEETEEQKAARLLSEEAQRLADASGISNERMDKRYEEAEDRTFGGPLASERAEKGEIDIGEKEKAA